MAECPLDDAQLETAGLFMAVHCGLTNKIGEVLTRHELSMADFEAMKRLAGAPGRALRMSDLAAQIHLSTSGLTRVVDRLDRSGLVQRQACEGDRRALKAVLTNKGEQCLRTVLPDVRHTVERWFTGQLEPAQLEALLDALRTIRDAAVDGTD